MGELFALWSAGTHGAVAELLSLAAGNTGPGALIAAGATLCLVAGLLLAISWREQQTWWMLPVVVLASLAPVVVGLASRLLGPLGIVFAEFAGAGMLLLATGLIANAATRRSPIWLVGAFSALFAAGCTLFGFDFAALG
jgi:hypothetical protein